MKRMILLIFLLMFSFSGTKAQTADAPISLQTIIIKKLMVAEQQLSHRGSGIVVVVYDSETENSAEMAVKALAAQGLKVEKTDNLAQYAGKNVNAIYFTSTSNGRPAFIEKERILTFGSSYEFALDGKVSISLRSKDGQLEVLVNKAVLESEGQGRLLSSIPKAVVI